MGLSLLLGARRFNFVHFNAEGTGGALATVAALAGLCLVLPTFTTGEPGPEFTGGQLTFAALASLSLYSAFVVTQTVRHRDFFLPVTDQGKPLAEDEHADPPTDREAWVSLGLLLLSLVAVVGLAKIESPAIESGVLAAGLPLSFVGVIIALLVLLPETIAAANAARRERIQTSLNLAMGSAMASIGLTIPTLAVASIWMPTPLHLGLGSTQIVLLGITMVVAVLTGGAGTGHPPPGNGAPHPPGRLPLLLDGPLALLFPSGANPTGGGLRPQRWLVDDRHPQVARRHCRDLRRTSTLQR